MTFTIIDQPPVDMRTPEGPENAITIVLGVLVVAAFAYSIYHWKKAGNPSAFLLTLGGFAVSLNEPLVDLLGHVYFPQNGIITHEFFGFGVQLWVVLAYVLFFGFFTWVTVEILKRGISYKSLWISIVVFFVLNAALEIPMLAADIYVYYGDQPLEVGGFPLAWLTTNCIGSFAAGVIAYRYESFFTGVRSLILVFLCYMTYMGSWVLSMPLFWALNAETEQSMTVLTVASVVSIALGLLGIEGLIRLAMRGQVDYVPLAITAESKPGDVQRRESVRIG